MRMIQRAMPSPGRRLVAAVGAAVAFMAAPATQAAEANAAAPPALVVAMSVDQLGAALFDAWRGRLPGGIGRLSREGIVYANAYQAHAATETCPGHATLLSGRHPAATGIVANLWYDTAEAHEVYCVQVPAERLVGAPEASRMGPDRLRTTTLGDWMKARHPASRVVAVSGKDRAAIMMGGHHADAIWWYEGLDGFEAYVPPGASASAGAEPLAAFNATLRKRWQRQPPVWNYTHADCRALARSYTIDGQAFDSRLPPRAWPANGAALGEAIKGSPFVDEATLDAARALLQGLQLGRDTAPDLLAISLSGTDYVGHRYGTQGPEMCEQMHALDTLLGRFLDDLQALDRPVLLVLSADHGGADFAERLQERGYPEAGRLPDPRAWLAPLNAKLRAELSLDYETPALLPGKHPDASQIYLVDASGHAMPPELRRRAVPLTLQWLRAQPEVALAAGREEILAAPTAPPDTPADELSLMQRLQWSTDAQRSGDIAVVLRPWLLAGEPQAGRYVSGHGSPYDIDRRVPIVFWSPGMAAQERSLPAMTVDIAPTLAAALGLRPPAGLDGRCRPLPSVSCR